MNLSLIMITKNAGDVLEKCLKSIQKFADEIIIVDDYSKDNTVKIAKKYEAKIYFHKENSLGKQKQFALSKTKGKWILNLDSDEEVSTELKEEIENKIASPSARNDIVAYYIPFQNHLFGRPINYGGENYKMLRLFRRNKALFDDNLVHESVNVRGKIGLLKNKIIHYSYRSLPQMYRKFTDYAIREAHQKYFKGEKSTFKKLFMYPIHMFWARFMKDKGYKDGVFRLVLDLGFAYMELAAYFLLFLYTLDKSLWTRPNPYVFARETVKMAFIIVIFKNKKQEIKRLSKDIQNLKLPNIKIINIDNTKNNRGYAGGVNEGIRKAIKDKCNLFIVLNPDISLKGLNEKEILIGGNHFDIWGAVMKQKSKVYYGGEIDKWRLSGGMIEKKPSVRFHKVDFVSGSFMIIKKQVIDRIGLFDESFFMYYEDVDFCYRARKASFRVGIDCDLAYKHFEKSKLKINVKNEYLSRNRWKFFWKYSNLLQKIHELKYL